MDDESLKLQKLLIEKLTADKYPVPSTEPSNLGTIGIIVLITILIVAAGIIIYYVFSQNTVDPYPLSPFTYGQKVVIRPAVLTDIGGDIEKQYLTQSATLSYNNGSACLAGWNMGSGANAVTFTGDKTDARSQWELMQFSSPKGYDANQSLAKGLGNRFFLRNTNSTDKTSPLSRIRYQIVNEIAIGAGIVSAMCPNTTAAVIGSDGCSGGAPCCNWYETELLVYFMPTNYKDIYYILYPSCASFGDSTGEINNGLASIRPWAASNTSNQTGFPNANDCAPCAGTGGTYNPYVDGNLSSNVMIMNFLTNENLLPPYENPNVHLFKVTVA